jgi:tRNA (cytidine/uridine-2'-O-)-methyltransferase
MNIVLIQPKMPANTGNIMRLCANSGCNLHLVGPLAFDLTDSKLKRAGLDYRDWAKVKTYADWQEFSPKTPLIGCSSKASISYDKHIYHKNDWLVFGSETDGIDATIRAEPIWQQWVTIPMHPQSRSLNLANSVSIILYEALRQLNYPNLTL